MSTTQAAGHQRFGHPAAKLREEIDMSALPLPPDRLAKAKSAFTTRRVDDTDLRALEVAFDRPVAGDLVLARVDRIGHHSRLQLRCGRRANLHVGDEIVVAFGERYAPDQFEAEIGVADGRCHLVAAGGLAGRVLSNHAKMSQPTELTAIGLITDRAGRRVNLRDYALAPVRYLGGVPVLAVLGTSMNAGKTTTAASLVRGLTLAGLKVGAAKVTGTGAGGDFWAFTDAGAHAVLDFTDTGHGSTYRVDPAEIEQTLLTLFGHLVHAGSEVIVCEVADGILQQETAALMRSPVFRDSVDGVVFAAGDAVSAASGAAMVGEAGLAVIGVSGVITQSPLASRECSRVARLPVLTVEQMTDPDFAVELLAPRPLRRTA